MRIWGEIYRRIFFSFVRYLQPRKIVAKPSLLVARMDGIGDYILFRPFFQALVQSKKYQGFDFYFLGNASYQEIFEKCDQLYFKKSFWIDPSKLNINPFYRYAKMKELNSIGFDSIVCPLLSRHPYRHDDFLRGIYATHKIAVHGDLIKFSKRQILISQQIFTHFYDAKLWPIRFEMEFNRYFMQWFIEEPIGEVNTKIPLEFHKSSQNKNPNTVVIFVGGSQYSKKWSPKYMAQVIQYLLEHHHVHCLLCGSAADRIHAKKIMSYVSSTDRVKDLTGKTSLLELCRLLDSAQMLISHESCAHHFAISLNCPCIIVIYNGIHYGRFVPYPEHPNLIMIEHPKICLDRKSYMFESNFNVTVPFLNIDEIVPERVIATIEKCELALKGNFSR